MDRIIGNIYETREYEKFVIMEKGNRVIDHAHKIERSILENGMLFSPILVNEKFEIIDGQNRFEALRKSRMPVLYMIQPGYGINEVRILNSDGKNWGKRDFINSFADEGNSEYVIIRDFMKKFPDFSAHIIEYILRLSAANDHDEGRAKNAFSAMRRGIFKIRDIERSNKIANMLLAYKQFHPNIYKRSTFVVAIIRLDRDPQFDNDEIVRKIQLNPRAFVPCVNSDEFIRMLEDIINFRSRNKVRFNV